MCAFSVHARNLRSPYTFPHRDNTFGSRKNIGWQQKSCYAIHRNTINRSVRAVLAERGSKFVFHLIVNFQLKIASIFGRVPLFVTSTDSDLSRPSEVTDASRESARDFSSNNKQRLAAFIAPAPLSYKERIQSPTRVASSKTESPSGNGRGQAGPLARAVSGTTDAGVPATNRRWVPPCTLRQQDALTPEACNDLIFRRVRGILNKLTPEKFKKLSDDLLNVQLNSSIILKGVILLIFDKALDEPKYSSMYAQLCKRLSEQAPNFEPDGPCTFRRLLLNKCRDEFQNRSQANEAFDHRGGDITPEEEERRQLAKRKMLGNIKFIGELGKLEILAESILHKCIQQLLLDKKRRYTNAQQGLADKCEDLECLSQILRTCGRILDTNKGQMLMDQYFERMSVLANNTELPPRIRFMLRDVIELRADKWVPRKATSTEGPMPIHQIRPIDDDAPGGYVRDRRDRNNVDRDVGDRPGSGTELFRHPMKMRSGLDDMFMNLNLSSPSTPIIPTHHDKYSSFNTNGYGGGGRDQNYRGNHNQRGGNYNNYNNQRGGGNYNKHNNQHNSNNNSSHNAQYNNANKEMAPRFKKNLMLATQSTQALSEFELRPSANSMLFKQTNMKPASTMQLGNRGGDSASATQLHQSAPPSQAPPTKPLPASLHKEPPLIIKQSSLEKPTKQTKNKGPNKEELLKKLGTLLETYLKSENNSALSETIDTYKECKIPEKFSKDVVLAVYNSALDKSDKMKLKAMELLAALRKESMVSTLACHDGLKTLYSTLAEKEADSPNLASSVAVTTAFGITKTLFGLADVAALTENGNHHPLFLLTLQQLNKTEGKAELTKVFNETKVNLMTQLPESERTKERLAEILEDRGLTFLYPLLRIQAELAKQLQADPNPQQFYKWIKDNLEPESHTDPGFVNALMTVLLKHITQESTLADNVDQTVPPDKALVDKERALLERYTLVLKAFLNERTDLQVIAVYSLQVYCFSLHFPKGMLFRWFVALYDLEVIEEEAFLHWKEDVTDAYPGKGQALFQVNQWLTWLQEAESEDDEADD